MRIRALGICLLLTVLGGGTGAEARIVGIGIAKSNDHVYAWNDDGMVTSGNSGDFEKYHHAYPCQLPAGETPADLVAVAISREDHVYAWFVDGKVSHGTTGDVSHVIGTYSLPNGEQPSQIVGIGIAGSDDHVYAWYADGTVSIGTSGNLGRYRGPLPYHLPDGFSSSDIVGIDIAANDHVYVWFRDGMASSGTSGRLDKYLSPFGYVGARVLYHFWGPSPIVPLPHSTGSHVQPSATGTAARP